MRNPELHGDSFLVIGFGREGRSVYRYLRNRLPSARIGIADREEISLEEPQSPHTELFSGPSYLSCAKSFTTIIRSPGVSIREITPHISSTSYLTSATNIFFAECPGKIVGITGTKGKSTTSSLTAAILGCTLPDVRLVGNIGKPMLDFLQGATSETLFVIELSSYQLEDLRRSPHAAILLNIVPEHLDYHDGFENYCAAKLNIARHQGSNDLLILNDSNQLLATRTAGFCGGRRYFNEAGSSSALVSISDGTICVSTEGSLTPLLRADELPVIGPGNLQNALAAITCAVALGSTPEHIHEALRTFKPLEHRLEFVAERCGVSFYNDSLSTIPEALAHALAALGDRVETVIAGGFDRGVDMTPLGPALESSQVKNLILFPTTGEKIWEAAVAATPDRSYVKVDVLTMEQAVQAAYNLTTSGRTCVMSPASSSFSVFRDYRDRGDQFKDAVRRLAPQEKSPADAA